MPMPDLQTFRKFRGPAQLGAAVVAVLVGISTAYDRIEPLFAATRGYAREVSAEEAVRLKAHISVETAKLRMLIEPTRARGIDIQISIAKNRQSQISDQLLSEAITLAKMSDVEDRVRKQFQIRKLEVEMSDLDKEVVDLRRMRERE